MKKAILLLLPALLLTGCQPKTYTITGTVADTELNGKYIYLLPYNSPNLPNIDSALIENNRFVFTGSIEEPTFLTMWFGFGGPPVRTHFILENGRLRANVTEKIEILGSPLNDRYTSFELILEERVQRMQEQRMKLAAATSAADSATIRDHYSPIFEQEYDEVLLPFILNNADNPAGALAFLTLGGSSMPYEGQEAIFQAATDNFLRAPGIERVKERFEVLAQSQIGMPFLDFEMEDVSGTKYKLSDYAGQGKVVLVDFWASWCGPCIAAFPALKETYAKYAAQGFEIVGVSLDDVRAKTEWMKEMEKNELNWPNFWNSPAAKLYGISRIPSSILLDQEGRIAAKDLSSYMLDEKLEELL